MYMYVKFKIVVVTKALKCGFYINVLFLFTCRDLHRCVVSIYMYIDARLVQVTNIQWNLSIRETIGESQFVRYIERCP